MKVDLTREEIEEILDDSMSELACSHRGGLGCKGFYRACPVMHFDIEPKSVRLRQRLIIKLKARLGE